MGFNYSESMYMDGHGGLWRAVMNRVKKLEAHKSLKHFEYLSDCKLLDREIFPLR